jgi:hypothetical protein
VYASTTGKSSTTLPAPSTVEEVAWVSSTSTDHQRPGLITVDLTVEMVTRPPSDRVPARYLLRDVVGPIRMAETYREPDISVSRTTHSVEDRDAQGTVVATRWPCASRLPGRVPRANGAAGDGHVARVYVPGAHRVRTC